MTLRPRLAAPLLVAAIAAAGCELSPSAPDSGIDAGADGSPDTADSDSDSALDAGPDAAFDAGDSGWDTDSNSADGTCEPLEWIALDASISGSTFGASNDLQIYSCIDFEQSGPDLAYGANNDSGSPQLVTAALSAQDADLDLFLLLDVCAADACAAHSAGLGDEQASAVLPPGADLFVAVDGFAGAAGPFELTLFAEAIEIDCSDQLDDDGDGATDCADDDCLGDPDCPQLCVPDEPLACGEALAGETSGQLSALDAYAPGFSGLTGPELVCSFFQQPGGLLLELTLLDAADGQQLFVLSGECSTAATVHAGGQAAQIEPLPGVPLYPVVDGPQGAQGSFTLVAECSEIDCADGEDNDGDGPADCADGDCEYDPACVTQCDPLHADAGCPSVPDGGAQACYLLEVDPLGGFCHPPGDAGVGDPCAAPHDCIPGSVCTPADVCLAACNLGDGGPGCDGGSCTSIGADPLGVCY
ncbi:MAG: hypothetical protein R6V85_04475 [Polyangia bacterium]